MPAIKFKPSPKAQKRDFWGDKQRGQIFEEQIAKKFGDHFGSRKTMLAEMGLQRRLFNMYVTGERNIPDEVWRKLRQRKNYNPNAPVRHDDTIDPLS
jgi:hypothetical protein